MSYFIWITEADLRDDETEKEAFYGVHGPNVPLQTTHSKAASIVFFSQIFYFLPPLPPQKTKITRITANSILHSLTPHTDSSPSQLTSLGNN